MKKRIPFLALIVYFTLTLLISQLCFGAEINNGSVFVLCYHSFLGSSKAPTDVSIQELKKQLEHLQRNGFRFVTFSQIEKGLVKGRKNILISIDDGNHSIIDANDKVFRPMGIKPLLGIYPNLIGKRDYALDWTELKRLSDDGFDIAAHGYYHLPLSDKFYNSNPKGFTDEIFKSRKMLHERLGRNIDVFIYPSGARNDQAKKMLKDAGYKYSFTIAWGQVDLPLSSNADPYELHRYMISGNFDQILSTIMNKVKN